MHKNNSMHRDDKFIYALGQTLAHEGGFVDHPSDPGGATKYGISLRFLRSRGEDIGDLDGDGDIDQNDIKLLSKNEVASLYFNEFWVKQSYGKLPKEVAARAFDMAVNMGPVQANKILQRAVCAFRIKIEVDGILGLQSEGAITTIENLFGSEDPLMAVIRAEHAAFYRRLTHIKPRLKPFLKGWLRRAYA